MWEQKRGQSVVIVWLDYHRISGYNKVLILLFVCLFVYVCGRRMRLEEASVGPDLDHVKSVSNYS